MQRIVWLAVACWLATSATVTAQSPDQQYVNIALLMQQAEGLLQNNQNGEALAKFVAARDELNRFQHVNPGWHPRIIEYRNAYLTRQIAALAGANPPPMNLEDLPSALRLLNSTRPLVIGHRGYPAFVPENTLKSFTLALEAGADLVELDYRHSKDGVPMIFHDATLDRTTDADHKWGADIAFESRDSEELRSLDAGSWFGTEHAGLKIPTLEEALDLISGSGIPLIERKSGDAAALQALLRSKGLVNKAVVISFDWDYLREFNRLAEEQVLGALGPPSEWEGRPVSDSQTVLNPVWIERLRPTGAKIIVWNERITPEAVQAAHERGYKVWVYTINDTNKASLLLDAGVDGLITDNPSRIWKSIALR